ncbi:hypothetical protein [Streptomyces sp. NPDC101132]|uniref:hypothetical protein n=1 Tax=Streptomyces sp. NPDC101132 TaxID=3366110 RepID=UPI00381179D0
MNQKRLAAGGAAAVIAAGLALTVVGAANAEPAARPERITSVQQLHESLRQAVEQERPQALAGTIGGTTGRLENVTDTTAGS